MRHYLMYHRSEQDSQGYTIDYYHNDPYVWHDPYLWSFCHFSGRQRPTEVEQGSVIVWLTRDEGKTNPSDPYFCSLVFVVGRVRKLKEARSFYGTHDKLLDHCHFEQGLAPSAHPDANLTCEADMTQSFIPHPAVEVSHAIDMLRENPLSFSWGTRKPFLHFDEHMSELVYYIREHAQQQYQGALPSDTTASDEQKHMTNKKIHSHHEYTTAEHASPHRKTGTC